MTWDFLAGKLWIERGVPANYHELARFHYVAGRPGTWAAVWVAKYGESRDERRGGSGQGEIRISKPQIRNISTRLDTGKSNIRNPNSKIDSSLILHTSSLDSRIVAIAVLSWPPLGCSARQSVLPLMHLDMRQRAAWLNQNVRTISRVVVHPQFRGVGLASELVRHVLRQSPTRYVETIAAMGKVHPFFEKAGMRRIEHEAGKAYFIWDREDKIPMTNE